MKPKFTEEELEEILFPHPEVRETQDKLIKAVGRALERKKNLIVHAPTGLGKTAATLAPALAYAIKNDLTVFFLTSRHMQHRIAIETMKNVKEKFENEFIACSIIGKKWMCAQDGVDLLRSGDFHEFCKSMIEGKKCEFYMNTYKGKKKTPKAAQILEELETKGAVYSEEAIDICKVAKLCPYEISCQMASKAKVIVTDYYYVFNPDIRGIFFNKTGKELEKSIIIVDEGHNLGSRVRDLMTSVLSSFATRNALKEAKKFGYEELISYIAQIQEALLELSSDLDVGKEKLVNREEFVKKLEQKIKEIDKDKDYDELIAELAFAAEAIRQSQRMSYLGSIADFLEAWYGSDDGFARIISIKKGKREPLIVLSYRCLDPSLTTRDVIDNAQSLILMSGTLSPTEMYADLLGFKDKETFEEEFENPFPAENRLNLIIPKTTTKYDARSEKQYQEIANILVDVTNTVPGNCAVFFPSYNLRDSVNKYFQFESRKTVFKEMAGMSKPEKEEILEKFKKHGKMDINNVSENIAGSSKARNNGAVLLGATSGSFGEGIDLPGSLLNAVVVVGLPLSPPDLETKELIRYYEEKFGRGWAYGYVLPAFIKTLQNAGRCIRSETDKGIVVFLDQRYTWSNYFRLFPKDWELKISVDYVNEIRGFFENTDKNHS